MPDDHDRHGAPAPSAQWERPPASEQRRLSPHSEEKRRRWRIFSRRAPRGDIGVPGKKFSTHEET